MQRKTCKPCTVDNQIRGVDVIVEFARKTGKVLPDHFWQFYTQWCAAYQDNDKKRMAELSNNPEINQYVLWIREINSVLINPKS